MKVYRVTYHLPEKYVQKVFITVFFERAQTALWYFNKHDQTLFAFSVCMKVNTTEIFDASCDPCEPQCILFSRPPSYVHTDWV